MDLSPIGIYRAGKPGSRAVNCHNKPGGLGQIRVSFKFTLHSLIILNFIRLKNTEVMCSLVMSSTVERFMKKNKHAIPNATLL